MGETRCFPASAGCSGGSCWCWPSSSPSSCRPSSPASAAPAASSTAAARAFVAAVAGADTRWQITDDEATLLLMLFKRVLLGDCDTQFCIINDNKLIQNVMMTEALSVKAQ